MQNLYQLFCFVRKYFPLEKDILVGAFGRFCRKRSCIIVILTRNPRVVRNVRKCTIGGPWILSLRLSYHLRNIRQEGKGLAQSFGLVVARFSFQIQRGPGWACIRQLLIWTAFVASRVGSVNERKFFSKLFCILLLRKLLETTIRLFALLLRINFLRENCNHFILVRLEAIEAYLGKFYPKLGFS